MGFFEKAGRRVEQFKRTAQRTAEGNADYECRRCDEQLHADLDRCPECGSESITPTRTTE